MPKDIPPMKPGTSKQCEECGTPFLAGSMTCRTLVKHRDTGKEDWRHLCIPCAEADSVKWKEDGGTLEFDEGMTTLTESVDKLVIERDVSRRATKFVQDNFGEGYLAKAVKFTQGDHIPTGRTGYMVVVEIRDVAASDDPKYAAIALIPTEDGDFRLEPVS